MQFPFIMKGSLPEELSLVVKELKEKIDENFFFQILAKIGNEKF